MSNKSDVIIKNKFGTNSASRYILRYTSRKDATESLDLNSYITKYTTRYSAVEQMKYDYASEEEILSKDMSLSRKDGVLFGNRGLSYTDEMLKEAALKTQKATNDGHVAILPILSFSHDYLKKHKIIPEDMEKPTKNDAGIYKGQVDQLKLRQAVTDMMDGLHRDMGFSNPEWTGTIQLDTTNVHVHLTSVETGKPKAKRIKMVREKEIKKEPAMKWHVDDKTTPYVETFDERGILQYERDGKIIANQELTQKGLPKYIDRKNVNPNSKMIPVEKGVINEKTKDRMRFNLNRSLSKKRDIRPFVKSIYDKRQLTKSMTQSHAFYNGVTAEKLQVLQASLPDNKRMWRADSYAKAMERPLEISNEIVDDIWTKNDNAVRLQDFDEAVIDYIDARQTDEGFEDNMRQELYENAYDRLRRETINGLFKSMKELDEKDKRVEVPKYSIQATSTEALENEIADMHQREPKTFDKIVMLEYRSREYNDRFKNAYHNARYYQKEVNKYDDLQNKKLTTPESQVVRDYYMNEYKYNSKVSDKYAYLTMGKESGVSGQRFKDVKGTDLVNMLYDYGPRDNRVIPKAMAEDYKKQTDDRYKAMRKTMDYLIQTGQYEQYEIMREQRDSLRREKQIANQIDSELQMPTPSRKSDTKIETKKTIDTYQGRKMLKNELYSIERTTRHLRENYEKNTDFEKVPKRSRKKQVHQLEPSVRWDSAKNREDIRNNHINEYRVWSIRRMQFEQFKRDKERREKEEQIQQELEEMYQNQQREYELAAKYQQEMDDMDQDVAFEPENNMKYDDKSDDFERI